MNKFFSDKYRDKTVLITGVTGFKGSWLCIWLLRLGAKIVGIANGIPTKPSLYEELQLKERIVFRHADVRDQSRIISIVNEVKPDYIFHLAAQAIVSQSYQHPVETLHTNVLGTLNILEALRLYDSPCSAVIITSDKCYENIEWEWGYKETDHLGGKDVYSASKAAAEIISHAYHCSFFVSTLEKTKSFATVRAGNVIGGGDWSADRIVVDSITKWVAGEEVLLRNPLATRPWQHVLEPLSGYLLLGSLLSEKPQLHGESFNFGPRSERPVTVKKLIQDLQSSWMSFGKEAKVSDMKRPSFGEAGLLKLNCDKALFHLGWEATLGYQDTVKLVSDWYQHFYYGERNALEELTLDQIAYYENLAIIHGLGWTK